MTGGSQGAKGVKGDPYKEGSPLSPPPLSPSGGDFRLPFRPSFRPFHPLQMAGSTQ